jgi:uncharacterized protein DUF6281
MTGPRHAALLAAVTLLPGCGSSGNGSFGGETTISEATCAYIVEYEGRTYQGTGVRVAPTEGKPLGAVTDPPCRDTPNAPDNDPAREVELAEIEGVAPEVAIVERGQLEVVLVAAGVGYDHLPPELARLFRTPSCDPRDAPIELSGLWRGILGADGHTELDLAPPYDVLMLVERSSVPRYDRAFLTVRVPTALGRPLDRSDIETSLWEGGTISVTAGCRNGRFVARHVEAQARS